MTVVELSRALWSRRGAIESSVWYAVAYLGRYAGQPLSEVLLLTTREANALMDQVSAIVEEEHRPPGAAKFIPDPDQGDPEE